MEIALALSGGGYRAAVYHIGVLSYLAKLQLGDDGSVLDHVNIISGVSGGALTALCYAIAELNGEDRMSTLIRLYKQVKDLNIGKVAADRFAEDAVKGKELIRVLADLYDEAFFNGRKFGALMTGVENSHLHHVTVSATDFSTGHPFRFQATKSIVGRTGELSHGWIGNYYNRLRRDVAADIRLADVLAASSCFPIAFEPIMFPTHFVLSSETIAKQNTGKKFGLMDGGMIDNQSIDAVIRTEEHLKSEGKNVDLVIVSDVSTLSMDAYAPSVGKKAKKWSWKWIKANMGKRCNTASKIEALLLMLFLLGVGVGAWAIGCGNAFVQGCCFMMLIVVLCLGWLVSSQNDYWIEESKQI